MARNKKRKKKVPRVRVVVTAEVVGMRHVVALDLPRDGWSLADLHELGRTVADAAGFLGGGAGAVSIDVSYSRGRA